MSSVRVLVGPRKGAFVLTADGARRRWEVAGPHFAGWEVFHVKGSPADPNRLYATQHTRLVRAGRPAFRRRRPDVDGGRQPVRLPNRVYAAISAAGAFRSDDAGASWRPVNRGLESPGMVDPKAEVGHCVHRLAMHPSRPDVLFMQKHWDVMRSDDAGETWREISRRGPRPRAGDRLRRSDQERYRALPARRAPARLPQPDRRRRVGGADRGAAAARLLRQRAARRTDRRRARPVRRLLRDDRRAGLRLGRRRGHLGADRARPAGRVVRRSPDAALNHPSSGYRPS